MLFPKFAFVLGLISLLEEAIAQQAFESHGPNYHAKVMIHRNSKNNRILESPDNVRFSNNNPNSNPYPSYDPNRQEGRQQGRRPWKQGNRITKQEVVQNVAKALLTRKSERMEEMRKQKKEVFKRQQERAKAKKLTNELRRMESPPQLQPQPAPAAVPQNPPPPPPRAMNYLQDSWRGGPPPRPRNRNRNRRAKVMRSPALASV